MIEGMEPVEFRRRVLAEQGKTSFVPNEGRYNKDGAYAFKLDSRSDHSLASLIVCKLVDAIELEVSAGKSVTIDDLDAWHVEYAKTGFRTADMAEIAILLTRDPMQALRQMKAFLMSAPPLPEFAMPSANFADGARYH